MPKSLAGPIIVLILVAWISYFVWVGNTKIRSDFEQQKLHRSSQVLTNNQ